MSYAHSLKEFVIEGASAMIIDHWRKEGMGLTLEDYWIFVSIVGHQDYRMYNDAHWRDSDIVDKSDVWKKLKSVEVYDAS